MVKTIITAIFFVLLFSISYYGTAWFTDWTIDNIDQSEPDYTKTMLQVNHNNGVQNQQVYTEQDSVTPIGKEF